MYPENENENEGENEDEEEGKVEEGPRNAKGSGWDGEPHEVKAVARPGWSSRWRMIQKLRMMESLALSRWSRRPEALAGNDFSASARNARYSRARRYTSIRS
jgi:hypothetical protein